MLLVIALLPSSSTAGDVPWVGMEPREACEELATGSYALSSWTFDDCLQVWDNFRETVPAGFQNRLGGLDLWGDAGVKLRQGGSPCLMESGTESDGAGSSTIRHLATWIYSRQMGCDWVTPHWGKQSAGEGGNGTAVLYCHRTATTQEIDLSRPAKELRDLRRCSVIDWLSYFNFAAPSVEIPLGAKLEKVAVSKSRHKKIVADRRRPMPRAIQLANDV